MNSSELVVLIDENNTVLGTMPKSEVHNASTPLHRAFSLFLFNQDKKLLLQQRSHIKKTWPLAWSNSCCGHPGPDESNIDAIQRRLKDELGMTAKRIQEISPYRYQFSKDGVMENEICPIHIGYTEDTPVINPDEVEAIQWISWDDFLAEIHNQGKALETRKNEYSEERAFEGKGAYSYVSDRDEKVNGRSQTKFFRVFQDKYSPWCVEEAIILGNSEKFKAIGLI